eukprot:751273-Hanusia_phi.AAC.2
MTNSSRVQVGRCTPGTVLSVAPSGDPRPGTSGKRLPSSAPRPRRAASRYGPAAQHSLTEPLNSSQSHGSRAFRLELRRRAYAWSLGAAPAAPGAGPLRGTSRHSS